MAGRPQSAAPGVGTWSSGGDTSEEEEFDEDGNPIEKAPMESAADKGLRLIVACKDGDEDEARRLCLENADVTVEDPLSKWTALLWASCNGNLDCVDVLLDFKASHMYLDAELIKLHGGGHGMRPSTAPPHLEGKGNSRSTLKAAERNSPLHWAAFKGHLAIVWRLMNNVGTTPGLDIHDVDAQGNTTLHLAAAGGHVPVVICLLANGADVNTKNYYGNPPLSLATKYEVRQAMTQLMRQPTFELNMDDWRVGDPLDLDTACHRLRRTTIAMRGARVLCCGPWCRSTAEFPGAPEVDPDPDKPYGIAELSPGKFWSVTSCVKQDVKLVHDRKDTRPAMVCKICVEMMKQAEEELRIAIEDKSLDMVIVAYAKAKARGVNVGGWVGDDVGKRVGLNEGKLMEARLRAENELNAAASEILLFEDDRLWQVPRHKRELERLFRALEDAMVKQADSKLLLRVRDLSMRHNLI